MSKPKRKPSVYLLVKPEPNGAYLRSFDEGDDRLRECLYTYKAARFEPEEAYRVCHILRENGHPFAVVTTVRGDALNPRSNIVQDALPSK